MVQIMVKDRPDDVSAGSPPEHDSRERPSWTSAGSLVWLLVLFFVGFVLITALHSAFSDLLDELAAKNANEQARLAIGDEIIDSIHNIEKDFYRMATIVGVKSQERVGGQISDMVREVRHYLDVLAHGGTIHRQLLLNLEGRDRMERQISYRPNPGDARYVMEKIELTPHLDEVETRVLELARLLRHREEHRNPDDLDDLLASEKEVNIFLKKQPPFFTRINENANRLLFESNRRLRELEQQSAAERRRYKTTEVALVVLVIASIMLVSFFMARQVNRTNRALQQTWEDMRIARDEAERASQAKSHFVSRMSHELRTPLNAILGFSQLLERGRLLPAQAEYVREINKAGRHLLDLINHVLDLAKIEAGHLVLERTDFDLVETVDMVSSLIAESAYSKGLTMRVLTSPDTPVRIKGDSSRLREVLVNLLGNAVKFTQHGEVGIQMEPSDDGTKIQFRIWDTGIGIEEHALQRLFRPFAQADESITRQYGGTGLGLMICKELVAAMGGQITVESKPGAGTAFCFDISVEPADEACTRPQLLAGCAALTFFEDESFGEVLGKFAGSLGAREDASSCGSDESLSRDWHGTEPTLVVADAYFRQGMSRGVPYEAKPGALFLALVEEESTLAPEWVSIAPPLTYTRFREAVEGLVTSLLERRARMSTGSPLPEKPASHVRILVVEDNPVNQLVASGMLKALGLEADVAPNGEAALRSFREKPYDIIFMDVEMPVLDGYSATRGIRDLEEASGRRRTPVIAMTANALSEDQARCIEAGMDDHLAKPLELERLGNVLRVWVPSFNSTG